ncbi:11172_t:CDS:10 [Acaulospora colombiana]|uniref:11172_t:CDS:1 n=1 Tax=Acaulospora colombiana TaxID=27376 RepID=A0ACA9MTR4_9GLOM|nr:11172_t:CDS:10 [Acaulospora colombiana]
MFEFARFPIYVRLLHGALNDKNDGKKEYIEEDGHGALGRSLSSNFGSSTGLLSHPARMSQDLLQEFASWGRDHGFDLNEISTMVLQLPYVMQNISASSSPFDNSRRNDGCFMGYDHNVTRRTSSSPEHGRLWLTLAPNSTGSTIYLADAAWINQPYGEEGHPSYILFMRSMLGFATASMASECIVYVLVILLIFDGDLTECSLSGVQILFDIVIFVLTAIKAKQDNVALQRSSRQTAPVLVSFYLLLGIYCVLIIALRIINFAAWAFMDESLVYIMIVFLWAMVTTLINRFYLNLRRVAYTTAAAILTNASIRERERPIQPGYGHYYHGGVGATAGAYHGGMIDTYTRKGAQSPWIDLEDGRSPILDIIRNGVVDEVVIAEVGRQRAAQGGVIETHGSVLDATGGDRSWYNRTTDFPEMDEEEPIPLQPPAHGILVSQGQKRGQRPEPGFTDEELQYLETTLQIIESISLDTLRLNEKEDGAINMAGEDSPRPSPHPDTDIQANPTIWNKLNSALLARSTVGSVQTLVGVACLFAGLKIMAASEDGFELLHK